MNDINDSDNKIAGHSLSGKDYARIFRSIPAPAVVTTMQEGRFVDVNDAFCRETGYLRSEVLGHTAIELGFYMQPEERAMVEEAVEHGGMYSKEMRFRMKSGETAPYLMSICAVDREGEPCQLSILQNLREETELSRNCWKQQSSSKPYSKIRGTQLAWRKREIMFM